MAQSRTPAFERLEKALARLEEQVETPVVAGELMEWCKHAQAFLEELDAIYLESVQPSHREQIAEIRSEDPEMHPLASNLAEEDEAIVVELARLGALATDLVENVDEESEQPDATGTADTREQFVEGTLALIIRVRTFEASLRTWLVEAFQRDRGIAD